MKNNNITYYDKLRVKSDELYNNLNLNKFLRSRKDIEKAKNDFYNIVSKLYFSIKNNKKNEYTNDEINFIIDFEVYKHIKEIIDIVLEFDQSQQKQ